MDYAIIRIKGTQHKVSEGDEILIDKMKTKTVDAEVLLTSKKGKVSVGKPTIKSAKVKIKVLEELVKGDKLYVQTYKAKSRYRRKIGFRPQFSKILIEKIT